MTVENEKDLEALLHVGAIVARTILHMADQMEVGMTTRELDEIGAKYMEQHGAQSGPIAVYDYPGHTCISINDEAAHGVPGDRVIKAGDLVNIDVTAVKDGYFADSGGSFAVPPVSALKEKLLASTKRALHLALDSVRAGQRMNMVGRAVERYAKQQGFNVIRELGGHGVGREIHEEPHVRNVYDRGNKLRFREGTVLTIEPFLTTGARHVDTMNDGWTLKTKDGSLSAQFEHTIVVTRGKPILITHVEESLW
jgi:methionyl aminopeptidase